MSKLVAVAIIVVLIVSLVEVEFTVAADPGPQATARVLLTEAANLQSTASALLSPTATTVPSEVASPVASSKSSESMSTLKEDLEPKNGATYVDCEKALSNHSASHYWAYVGECEGALKGIAKDAVCPHGFAFVPAEIAATISDNPSHQQMEDAYDQVATNPNLGFNPVAVEFGLRLLHEAKPLPDGAPTGPPHLLDLLIQIGCDVSV